MEACMPETAQRNETADSIHPNQRVFENEQDVTDVESENGAADAAGSAMVIGGAAYAACQQGPTPCKIVDGTADKAEAPTAQPGMRSR